MNVSALAKWLWGLSAWGTAGLLLVLLVRRRWRQFPMLVVWLGFETARSLTLYVLYRHGWFRWYAHLYWGSLVVDFALQLAVAIEIARIVLRPTETWVRDAWLQFCAAGVCGAAIAALVAWGVTPPATSIRSVWMIRGNLFTSLVICELFVVMSVTANRLGLGWRNHVMALGQGLTLWSGVMVLMTALQSFLGTQNHYVQLDQGRIAAYIVAVAWIIVQLWKDEPERQPIAPELREYILALHKRVEYDLRRIDARH